MKTRLTLWLLAATLAGPATSAPDADGCKDVFVSRLAGYELWQCEIKDFDSFTFAEGTDKQVTVEGRIVDNWYRQKEGAPPMAPLTVRRNYENALRTAGWTLVYSDADTLTEKQMKDGQERWVQLMSNDGSGYELRLAAKGSMEQTVVTADDMRSALVSQGHIALNINFDTGKSVVREESRPVVDQIVALLKGDPALRLGVEGHTDNVGNAAANKTLSQQRAAAVVALLVKAGIDAGRLTPAGFGQERPVADNATDAGRAENRRVELVRK